MGSLWNSTIAPLIFISLILIILSGAIYLIVNLITKILEVVFETIPKKYFEYKYEKQWQKNQKK